MADHGVGGIVDELVGYGLCGRFGGEQAIARRQPCVALAVEEQGEVSGARSGGGHAGEVAPRILARHVGADRRGGNCDLCIALQPAIKPGERHGVPVERGLAQRAVANRRARASERAVLAIGEDDGLRSGQIVSAHFLEARSTGRGGDIVQRLGIEARDLAHVLVGDSILGPGSIRRAACEIFVKLRVGGASGFRDVDHRQMHAGGVERLHGDRFRAFDRRRERQLLAFLVRQAGGKLWPVEIHLGEEVIRPAHLPDAAAPEIAAFIVRPGLRDADAGRAGDHRLVRRVAEGGELQLVFRRGGTSIGADGAVGPGLGDDPFEGVPAVFIRHAEHAHFAFGEEASALVLLHHRVASLEQL